MENDFQIAGSQFTLKFLEKVMINQGIQWPIVKPTEENVKVDQIAAGKGCCAFLYRISLIEYPESCVIMKIPTGEIMRNYLIRANKLEDTAQNAALNTTCKMLTEIHQRELQIYQLARNRFLDGPMRIPRFYYGIEWDIEANKQGVIIMEDLTQKCAATKPTTELNCAKVLSLFDAIAHWQSETLIDENEEQKPCDLPPITSLKPCDLPPITSLNRLFGEHSQRAVATLAAKIPDTLTETRCSQINSHCSVESIQKILRGGGPHKVIVHADLWPNNILWTQSINDPAVAGDELLALLDWQAALYGSPTIDLASILCVSCGGDFRRANEMEMIEFYWKKMKKYCENKQKQFKMTQEQVHGDYLISRQYAVLQMLLTVASNVDLPTSESDNEGMLIKRLRMLVENVFP